MSDDTKSAAAAGRPGQEGAATMPCTLGQFLGYFLRLGAVGFGGPIALAGYMQRDLVEERRWVSKQDYVEGLAFAQLCPGPLAAQLAMYLGWVRALPRGHARRRRLCRAVVPDGPGPGSTLRTVRGAALDAGGLLRRRRGRHRHPGP